MQRADPSLNHYFCQQAPLPESTGQISDDPNHHLTKQLIMQHSFQWALVGGGPHIAGKYDKLWRYALLTSLATSAYGMLNPAVEADESLLSSCNQQMKR